MWPLVISALSLGFLGSFHCIGMCGPIALALPVQHLTGGRKMAGILLYNGGRISSYAMLGLFFGWLGRQFYLGGLQQWLSIALGAALLLIVLLQYVAGKHMPVAARIGWLTGGVRKVLGKLLHRQQFSTLYAIGFFNGLLPCGLVYLGIAGSLATVHAYEGALFMAAFGAGTLPAMAAVTGARHLISLQIRNRVKRLIPVVITTMGLLLIVRGLNLGIPYISPSMHRDAPKVVEHCCHK